MALNTRHSPPRASAMIEALRGLGYSTASALADIIDNSIAAHAHNIDLQFTWNGEQSIITILDDGGGMDEAELERAMRLGDKSPLAVRAEDDLGRFGLGLKTASFSQCRSLTVISKKMILCHACVGIWISLLKAKMMAGICWKGSPKVQSICWIRL